MTELKLQQCRLDGRYDVQDCLGRGSYAEIYIARDGAAVNGASQTVVIKALNVFLQGVPDADLQRTLIENFQNEAMALDRVRHPNIIARYGHGTAIDLAGTTFHYLVLEYLPGGDMAVLSRHHPLAIERALFYLEQVCAGLAHAHARGVIHRDIKPQNLLLTADRQTVKIADFGVAKIEAGEGEITRVGTNLYAAPEHNPLVQTAPLDLSQIGSEKAQLTPAADIYSLAKTTYALLSGESPKQFSHRPITQLPQFLAEQPWGAKLLCVLERATQNEAGRRYQTVEAFWTELTEAAHSPAQSLTASNETEPHRRLSGRLGSVVQAILKTPPQPSFDSAGNLKAHVPQEQSNAWPRIVVPVKGAPPPPHTDAHTPSRPQRQTAYEAIAALPDSPPPALPRPTIIVKRAKRTSTGRLVRLLIVVILISAFAGLLAATYKVLRSRTIQNASAGASSNVNLVGREAVTTIDSNLRPAPGMNNTSQGVLAVGSRVRILEVSSNGNWCRVKILQRGDNSDSDLPDEGWIFRNQLSVVN